MKTFRMMPALVEGEEIPDLRAALAEERQQEEALASVSTRAEAANYAWATARAYRTNLIQRAAAGEPVDPGEILKAEADIADAKAAAATFPDIIAMAKRNLTRATGGVTSALRAEMQWRREIARTNAVAAEKRLAEAIKDCAKAAEQLWEATVAASLDSDTMRRMFASEIEAVS
jgi:hypothetical protein